MNAVTGALGSMVNDAWKRGRRTGFLEGLVLGFLAGVVIVALKVLT